MVTLDTHTLDQWPSLLTAWTLGADKYLLGAIEFFKEYQSCSEKNVTCVDILIASYILQVIKEIQNIQPVYRLKKKTRTN